MPCEVSWPNPLSAMASQSDWKPGGTRKRRVRPAGGKRAVNLITVPTLREATGSGHNERAPERLRNRPRAVEPRHRCLAKIRSLCRSRREALAPFT